MVAYPVEPVLLLELLAHEIERLARREVGVPIFAIHSRKDALDEGPARHPLHGLAHLQI